MAEPNPVYDDNDEKPVTGPDLRAQEGINTDRGKSGGGQSDDKAGGNTGGSSSNTGRKGASVGIGGRDAGRTGSAPGNDDEDEIPFNPNDKKQRGNMRLVLRAASKHRKVMLIGTGVAGSTVGTLVVIFLMLIPLKIEHIVTNLESKMFASSDNAVDSESENMLSDYVKHYVLPALTRCRGTSIDKSCNPAFSSSGNPVNNLYKGWSQAGLENKLASDYGIEFRATKSGSVTKYYMKAPGIKNPNGDDITSFQTDGKDLFQEVDRGQVRQTVKDAFANETLWKKVMYRYKVGRLLEEKYGLTRCLAWCGQRDALTDFPAEKKNAAQIFLVQRVIVPRTETLGIVMECLTNPNCHPEDTQPTTPQDGSTGELSGAPENPDTDTQVRTTMAELAQSYGVTDKATIQAMIDDYKNVSENGYQKFALEKVLSKIGLGDLSGTIIDKATIVGWVNQVSQFIGTLKQSGPKLKKLDYVTNSTADVKVFEEVDSYAPEIHTGHADLTELGSLTSSLGPSTTSTAVGGTAGAEEAPLYNVLVNNTSSTKSKNYLCSDHKPPSGLACPEEKLGGGDAAASAVTGALSAPPLSYISDIAGAWNGVVGSIFSSISNVFGSVIDDVPGVHGLINDTTSFVTEAAQPFFKYITEEIVPDSFGVPEGGGREFQQMAAGAQVAGNTFAHTGLGAATVSTTVAAHIATQQEDEAQQDFSHQSFFARMFSTDSPYSLVSRVAMDIPLNFQASAGNTFASLLSNPFGAVSHSFASIFSGKVSADAQTDAIDAALKAFDDTSYAYLSVPAHAATYWNNHCSENAAQAYQNDADFNNPATNWNDQAAANPDPNTGEPSNSTTNPCLLIKDAVGSTGGLFDSSLLTSDDTADLSNNGTSNGSVTGPAQDASKIEQGTEPDLAKKLLGYQSTGQYKCDNPGDCTDLQKVVNGQTLAGSDGCQAKTLDPRVIQLLLYLIEVGNFKIGTFAMCGDHSFDSLGGHSGGFAVDISSVNGASIADDTQAAATQGLAMDKFLNNLPKPLQLNQQISYGYGNHSYQPMADLQQAGGTLCTSSCVSFYTLTVEEEHENHIHAGF